MKSIRYIAKPHATLRYQQHHPTAIPLDLVRDIQQGSVLIGRDIARTLLGRFRDKFMAETETEYQLSSDRAGIFAVVDSATIPDTKIIVTYLRLGDAQREFALRNWSKTPPRAEGNPEKEEKEKFEARMHPVLEVHVSQIEILPVLHEMFGSKNKARRALLASRGRRVALNKIEFLVLGKTDNAVTVHVHLWNNRHYAGTGEDEFPS